MTVDDLMVCAFVHKYIDAAGEKLFKEMIDCIERIGELSGQESMPDAVNAVENASKLDLERRISSSKPPQLRASL